LTSVHTYVILKTEVIRMSVLTREKEICELRTKLNCSQETMARILGVSSKTVVRWEGNESHPSSLARQRLSELQKVVKKMQGVIKRGKEAEWLNSPNEALGGKTPLEEMMSGPEGIGEVLHLLGRLEWGIAT
jgi:putative toxin-antitoxin system antitoxin component (TIGR02293 family)